MSDGRLDSWLDGSGFDPVGAPELIDAVGPADDPWRDAEIESVGLTLEQRRFVDATSPGRGAALGGGALFGGRPFAELDDADVADADDEIIDFDPDDDD